MRRFYLSLFILILLSACKPVAKLLVGVKNPKQTTVVATETWAAKRGYDIDRTLYLSAEGLAERLVNGFDNNLTAYTGDGYLIPYLIDGDTITCSVAIDWFVANLEAGKAYPTDTTQTLATALAGTLTPTKQPFELANLPPADFYILGHWATYMGTLNSLDEWNQIMADNQRARVHLIKVNSDFLYPADEIERHAKAVGNRSTH